MQPSLLWIATVFFKITLNHYKTPCIVSFWQLPDDCFSWSMKLWVASKCFWPSSSLCIYIYIYIYIYILRILCFQKAFWFGQSFSMCPSSSVHTAMCSGELFPKGCMPATLGTRSFSAAAPKFWNSLPAHIHNIQSFASAIKRLVKTFF